MRLETLWYPSESGDSETSGRFRRVALTLLLWSVSVLYRVITSLRRWLYRLGVIPSWKSPVPVIVVGNISVGGTGKTPLVIALVELLQSQGWTPGIVSRGYSGEKRAQPLLVEKNAPPSSVGDEPVLIAQRTGQPVCVCADRSLAVQHLLSKATADIIVCDDGLQHYALQRDIEIAVVDHQRQHGNQRLLPAGPLREPVSRLSTVDFIVDSDDAVIQSSGNRFSYRRVLEEATRLDGTERRRLQSFSGTRCHALAGIGHPQRFFQRLESLDIMLESHPFPDHHMFTTAEIDFPDDLPILMTEKDAVKCRLLAPDPARCWVAELHAELSANLRSAFLEKVGTLR